MFITISDKIRKVAALIERDNTPSNARIDDRMMLDDECQEGGTPKIRKKRVDVVIEDAEVPPTALPERRRPREQPSHLNKWNEDTKTELMNDYMKNYRADGKDKEVEGPNSTYKKKLKIK